MEQEPVVAVAKADGDFWEEILATLGTDYAGFTRNAIRGLVGLEGL
jgi:hypothetical protein